MKKIMFLLGISLLATATTFAQEEKKSKLPADRFIEKLDTNKDHKLSKEELKEHKRMAAKFEEIDTNNDNFISEDEVTSVLKKKRKMSAKHHREMALKRHEKVRSTLSEIDTNNDKQISKAEAEKSNRKRLVENFDKIDTNNDGLITQEEMKAIRAKFKERELKKRKS